ncbi:hypothetical protein SLA2020_305820 [Shorea laevis]
MSDEQQYSSGPEAGSNKRKYEDQPPLPSSGGRRPTGFSSPPASAPRSYNSVPPSLEGIEIAKQRAQEIAARLTAASAGTDAKRPRVENGSGGFDNERGFSSAPAEMKPMSNLAPSAMPVSYGNYHSTSKKIDIPQIRVGVIIGKAGETIKYLQLQSGAKIQVQRDMDADPNSVTRPVELIGTPEQIAKAEWLINDVLAEAEAGGGSGIVSRRLTGQAGIEHFEMKIPNNKVGLVIGKGGEMIKSMQTRTGARIQVIPLHLPPGDTSTERSLHIDGTSEQIKNARVLVEEVISENRVRNSAMTGGYPQQGYQARPRTNWGPQGAHPMQQPGYGYMQPGAYPAPFLQYSQPPYAGYPPQSTSGGYPSNWDQSAVPSNQQTTTGSGYDYYNQQPSSQQQQQTPGSSAAPADNSGYNYNQPPGSSYVHLGQNYPQDGYGGYHAPPQSAFGQPPAYDQQQQGYGSAAGYSNITNPNQEGHTPSYSAQGDSVQAPQPVQPSAMGQQGSNPGSYTTQPGYGMPPPSQIGYGSQPPAQSGYGSNYVPPQGQKPPPVYGQTQQSPSTPGSYGQPAPVQPGYPHSQPLPSGYGQPDSGSQRAPPSSCGAASAQPGYGPPSYGAPPTSQPGYGAPYNPYGGNYTQTSAYSADGSTGGGSRGSYEAAPASQGAQQSGVAKASPKS